MKRRYYQFENKDFMRIELAYERLAKDHARMEWVELSGPVESAAFVKTQLSGVLWGLISK
jgi:hypothetical protein